jgi:hypothetical protein
VISGIVAAVVALIIIGGIANAARSHSTSHTYYVPSLNEYCTTYPSGAANGGPYTACYPPGYTP